VRRFTTARALGLLAVALVLIAAMVGLGWWQYDAYRDQQADDAAAAADRPAAPLDDLLGPDEGFSGDAVSRPVVVSGRYDAAGQLYVEDLPGSPLRYAVVTPLVTATGSAILVVRGASDEPVADVPHGEVVVEGSLQPSQDTGSEPDSDRVTDGIRVSTLVATIDPDLYGGYVVLTSSDPSERLPAVEAPLPDPDRWAGIRNLVYAVQWWIFAAFVAFMWWRIVTDIDAEPGDDAVASAGSQGPERVG
jgi:cytochrome oxidase assembly protein ShyY1